MDIFVFEYATALNDVNFISEGRGMRDLIINGLKKEGIKTEIIENLTNLNFEGLEKIFEKVNNSDYTILIAPNYELLKISNFLNNKKVFDKVLISPIDALNKTLNKFNLYKEFKNYMPKTIKFHDFNFELDFPVIVKPIYGAGCEKTYLFKDPEYINAFNFDENFIIQEFISGIHTSICLFAGKKIYPVSLNKQFIKLKKENKAYKIEYKGSCVPFFNKFMDDIFELSISISKKLNLRGYIGMDFVIDEKNEKIYLIEVNPRITTSAIALSISANLNIGKLHIDCFIDDVKIGNIKFLKNVSVLKHKRGLRIICV